MRIEYKPRPYQKIIKNYILDNPRCAVWAGMGMGKTVSVLSAIQEMSMLGMFNGPALVLAPLRVARSVWPEEARKWEHLRQLSVMPVLGNEHERRQALRYKADIYTINYENLPWLVAHLGERWPFELVVADESTKLKGFRLRQGTQRATALAKVVHRKVKFYIGLTGTPAPNGLLDLWGQTWMQDAGVRLGRSYTGFKDRWFTGNYMGGVTPRENSSKEIYAALADICISLDAKDWFDLKEPIVNNIYVDLPSAARTLYKKMEKEFFIELEGHEIEAFNAAVRSQKLLQLANGAMYVDPLVYSDEQPTSKTWKTVHDAKIEALKEVVEEAAGMPVLVAYNFRSDLARLLKAFPQGRRLDDSTATIKEWNEGKIPILFSHPASAGHGLNLQHGGNIICFFGHNWNLEHRMQILERIGPVRQLQAGYNRPVFVHNIIACDTMDEIVMERVEGKKDIQELLLEARRRRA